MNNVLFKPLNSPLKIKLFVYLMRLGGVIPLLFFTGLLFAQISINCAPYRFEVCKVLPNPNKLFTDQSGPGVGEGFYTVTLHSTTGGLLPETATFDYLSFTGILALDNFSTKVNMDLTALVSDAPNNPFYAYLKIENGTDVSWILGGKSNCTGGQGESKTITLFPNGQPRAASVVLFTLVVEGTPGTLVDFTDISADYNHCIPPCSGSVTVTPCAFDMTIAFPKPATCNPEKKLNCGFVSLPLGQNLIFFQLQGLTPGQQIDMLEGTGDIKPFQMNAPASLDLTLSAVSVPGMTVNIKKSNKDGSFKVYYQLNSAWTVPPNSTGTEQLFTININGLFNSSQGVTLVCSSTAGRFGIADPQTICSLKNGTGNIVIPGLPTCAQELTMSAETEIDNACHPGMRFKIRHSNAPSALTVTTLKLSIKVVAEESCELNAFDVTLPANVQRSEITELVPFREWIIDYEYDGAGLAVYDGSEIHVNFTATKGCLSFYITKAEAVLSSNCAITIDMLGPNKICVPTIQGKVVLATNDHVTTGFTATLWNGNYVIESDRFCEFGPGYYFCPDASKFPFQLKVETLYPSDFKVGLTTYDWVLVSKHRLGIRFLSAPWELLAADVSEDAMSIDPITENDRLAIYQMNLHGTSALWEVPAWWMVSPDYQFGNPSDPTPEVNANNTNTIEIFSGGEHVFYGVKTGDVNFSVNCPQFSRSNETETGGLLRAGTAAVSQDGRYLSIPIYINADFDPIAFQAGFRFDASLYRFKDIVVQNRLVHLWQFGLDRVDAGELRFVWGDDQLALMPGKGHLFTLVLEKKSERALPGRAVCWSSDAVMSCLAYTEGGVEVPIRLELPENTGVALEMGIAPNPATSATRVFIHAANQVSALLRVVDATGLTLREVRTSLVAGENALQVDIQDLPAGVYLLSATAGGQTTTQRFVKI